MLATPGWATKDFTLEPDKAENGRELKKIVFNFSNTFGHAQNRTGERLFTSVSADLPFCKIRLLNQCFDLASLSDDSGWTRIPFSTRNPSAANAHATHK